MNEAEKPKDMSDTKPPGLSRRGFLKDASVVVGAAAAGVGGTALWNTADKVTQAATKMPTSSGVVVVDPDKCTGCGSCEVVCSLSHDGVIDPKRSRIRAIKDWRKPGTGIAAEFFPAACQQCAVPKCAMACPPGAITADPKTNARIINEELCTGCRKCIEACPYTPPRIYFDELTMKAFKCDLCGGDPMCVKVCNSGALKFQKENNITVASLVKETDQEREA